MRDQTPVPLERLRTGRAASPGSLAGLIVLLVVASAGCRLEVSAIATRQNIGITQSLSSSQSYGAEFKAIPRPRPNLFVH